MPEFDLEAFYSEVGVSARERHALRQDLVRGLKDYSEHHYGYDRYGGETVLMLGERLGHPQTFAFAACRILRDRRLTISTRVKVAERVLDQLNRTEEPPQGLFLALDYLAAHQRLEVDALRFGLVASAGAPHPFQGLEKSELIRVFTWLVRQAPLPVAERLFWGHSLVARHQDDAGAADLIHTLLGAEAIPAEDRRELARAWTNFRQPYLVVHIPSASGPRGAWVAEHLPFWLSVSPSWPTPHMIRHGLLWLARLGDDPLLLAQNAMKRGGPYAEQFQAGAADILGEFHAVLPAEQVEHLVEEGIGITGSLVTRRRFYRLGADLYGQRYLERATHDTAGSVRQWAAKQLQKAP